MAAMAATAQAPLGESALGPSIAVGAALPPASRARRRGKSRPPSRREEVR